MEKLAGKLQQLQLDLMFWGLKLEMEIGLTPDSRYNLRLSGGGNKCLQYFGAEVAMSNTENGRER